MTGRPDYEQRAEELLGLYPQSAASDARSFSFFLAAADFAAGPTSEAVIVGDPSADDTKEMLRALRRCYLPNTVVLLKPSNAADPPIVHLAPYTAGLQAMKGKATVYVCRNFTCSLPTCDVEPMLAELARP